MNPSNPTPAQAVERADSRAASDLLTNATFRWILRLGLACCFIGHGSLGLTKVAAWTSYFAVVGISPDHALALMPWVGAFDVMMALTVLFVPMRGVIFYMFVWTVWTALLRPLAGESVWEFIERAGNYGVPLALFVVLDQGSSLGVWMGSRLDAAMRIKIVGWILRLTTVLLLVGHGMLNCSVQKQMFVTQYNLLGLPGATAVSVVGVFECLLALAVLIKPDYRLLVGVVIWKLMSELLCPMAGASPWTVVEHGGSYAAPLVLAYMVFRARSGAVRQSAYAI